jgi:hypothetical protein
MTWKRHVMTGHEKDVIRDMTWKRHDMTWKRHDKRHDTTEHYAKLKSFWFLSPVSYQ